RALWSVLFSLMLVASCWGSVESPEQKALRHARNNLNRLYFDYVFAEENEGLLKALMVSVRRIYERYEQNQWLEDHSAPDYQPEARQQFLTRLIQQASRHTIAKVTGDNDTDDRYPDRPMFHLLQAFSRAPVMEEARDVIDWYRTHPLLLQGVIAEDRMDSMEDLIAEAVQNSFREFPSNPLSPEQLGRQLGFILIEMQELFLRGKALRSLGFKVDRQKQNPEIARDPAFVLYLSLLTEAFNNHLTLWRTDSKRRHYQEDLAALFMKAADREDYGNEWYQQVRRILDGEKPVSFALPPPVQKPVVHHYLDLDLDYHDWERWFKLVASTVIATIGITLLVCVIIAEHQTKSRRLEWLQENKLQRKLGRALNKPWRKDPKGRDWNPTRRDREEVREIIEGFDQKVWKNVMINAGVLNPLSCDMDLDNLYMQWSLTELYGYLRQEEYILTKEDKIGHEREQQEAAERARTASHTVIIQQQKKGETLFFCTPSYIWDSSEGDDGIGYSTSSGTSTTFSLQDREANWD
ncbi:hypothetical protein, partial [Endozoicomonas sp. ONNA1]|uniref:hypothetical protein n=1 Tax=Endozoicomonas sp. ONNA1 TaxID=2828740 RepID=UPI0021492D82